MFLASRIAGVVCVLLSGVFAELSAGSDQAAAVAAELVAIAAAAEKTD